MILVWCQTNLIVSACYECFFISPDSTIQKIYFALSFAHNSLSHVCIGIGMGMGIEHEYVY